MKKEFENRLMAINWIANNTDDEGKFEVLREQLNFNFIYTGTYFLDLDKPIDEVILFDRRKSGQ